MTSIYDSIAATLLDALQAGPHNIGPDKAGGLNADFASRLENDANELEAMRADGPDEARRAIALIRDVRAVSEANPEQVGSITAAMAELAHLHAWFEARG